MFSSLLISAFFVSKVLSHGDGDHDHDHAHETHRHADDTLPHCECITGITTDMLNCTDQATVTYLESLLMDNNCKSTCGYNVTSADFDLKCSQWFALLIQYHDWCELLTVTEELIHDLWDVCALDCLQVRIFMLYTEFNTINIIYVFFIIGLPNYSRCTRMF